MRLVGIYRSPAVSDERFHFFPKSFPAKTLPKDISKHCRAKNNTRRASSGGFLFAKNCCEREMSGGACFFYLLAFLGAGVTFYGISFRSFSNESITWNGWRIFYTWFSHFFNFIYVQKRILIDFVICGFFKFTWDDSRKLNVHCILCELCKKGFVHTFGMSLYVLKTVMLRRIL